MPQDQLQPASGPGNPGDEQDPFRPPETPLQQRRRASGSRLEHRTSAGCEKDLDRVTFAQGQ